jgi:hypothetical protein
VSFSVSISFVLSHELHSRGIANNSFSALDVRFQFVNSVTSDDVRALTLSDEVSATVRRHTIAASLRYHFSGNLPFRHIEFCATYSTNRRTSTLIGQASRTTDTV